MAAQREGGEAAAGDFRDCPIPTLGGIPVLQFNTADARRC